jgi:hypothetical protein
MTLTGQHDRTPVTTKHEKRLYANPLFAVSYASFQGRPLHSSAQRKAMMSVIAIFRQLPGSGDLDAQALRQST